MVALFEIRFRSLFFDVEKRRQFSEVTAIPSHFLYEICSKELLLGCIAIGISWWLTSKGTVSRNHPSNLLLIALETMRLLVLIVWLNQDHIYFLKILIKRDSMVAYLLWSDSYLYLENIQQKYFDRHEEIKFCYLSKSISVKRRFASNWVEVLIQCEIERHHLTSILS